MNNSASGIFKVYVAEKGGCSGCVGYVKNCKYCNEKIEILDHKVLDFHAGSPHRCRGRSWFFLRLTDVFDYRSVGNGTQ